MFERPSLKALRVFLEVVRAGGYGAAAARIGAARAGQAITMMPVFGAFLSAALLGEALHDYHYVGIAFILAGIVLGALAPKAGEAAGARQTARLEERP